ncbi:hypothetical protein K431DRAFT_232836 [Polychaeton citri CBS 116435]|uniref:Uncharacterized protein n=1 Tax=Polychaeton citri CBS 116435 TaxID=1314669 RepID=A0A9P4Q3V6_9PEZI|nr:hypothetical protein K431DRAFT_232836 [Polychaeton citri CBS 116435]
MSADSQPINPERFRAALQDLPLDSLHAKVAELRNNIGHLRSSNEQMLPFAEAGDQDCKDAMFENLSVIGRMNERIAILREEVEHRGMRWSESEEEQALAAQRQTRVNGEAAAQPNGPLSPGRLSDDELRRQLETQMADEEGDDGVHL